MLNLKSSIARGSAFLKEKHTLSPFFSYNTIFPTAIITECLSHVPGKTSRTITNKLSLQLLKQVSLAGSYNYWLVDSDEFKNEPYPDDLDDTFYVLSALFNIDKKLITGETLAQVTNLLISRERQAGGPYQTWLIDEKQYPKWDDIDLAVNANIAYFLSLQEITLEPLNEYIESQIYTNTIRSPYYCGKLPLLYFIARAYNGPASVELEQFLIQESKRTLSSLEKSLLLSSLLRIKHTSSLINKLSQNLVISQNQDGSWSKADFYYYLDKDKNSSYVGSKEITTAFALEALSLLIPKTKREAFNQGQQKSIVLLRKKTFEYVKSIPVDIQSECAILVEKMFEQDYKSRFIISLTPQFLYGALADSYKGQIEANFLILLSSLSFYGWVAYTGYDDVLDFDTSVEMVCLANVFSRKLQSILYLVNSHLVSDSFETFFVEILNRMEAANYWEVTTTRFNPAKGFISSPSYTPKGELFLAEKSLGHILAPVALLLKLGFSLESKEVKHLMKFFQHFLCAKQMSDDAHDWEADLKKGQINSATAELLEHSDIQFSLDSLEVMQQIFWHTVIPTYNQKIIDHILQAKASIKQLSVFENKEVFSRMLASLENATQETVIQRKHALDFMENIKIAE